MNVSELPAKIAALPEGTLWRFNIAGDLPASDADRVAWVSKSTNRKTGDIPQTYSEPSTCPPSCPLISGACYARAGYYTRLYWEKLGPLEDRGGEKVSRKALRAITKANAGRRGFTYTHKKARNNWDMIREAIAGGFTVNISADNLSEADTFAAAGFPVTVVMPENAADLSYTPGGRRVVTCPAISRDNVTCKTCGLCQKADRGVIIGFPAHGAGKGKINRAD